MGKDTALSFRIEPAMKEALERAAKADDRSVSSLVERILKAWLIERGHLRTDQDGEPPSEPS
jgi:hypothetical protein